MKSFLSFILCALCLSGLSQTFTMLPTNVTVVQINAEWNDKNTRQDLERLRGCEYRFGWLEDQPVKLQQSITAVPVVVIYRDGQPAWQFVADISFRLDTPFEEIQERVYEVKY